MTTHDVAHPPSASREEWEAARQTLLTHEKEVTRHYDRVNAERRRLPMVKLDKTYTFDGPEGKRSLLDLFADRQRGVNGRMNADGNDVLGNLR